MLGALCGLFLLAPATCLLAQNVGGINREYPLKALFLYNFGGYIEWPPKAFADQAAPFVIGVFGASPLDETLDRIAEEKKMGQRPIKIVHYRTPAEVKDCQILFLPANVAPQEQLKVIDMLKGRPVLTVGETPNFASNGGCINFFIEANKIRFEINVEATKQQQLKINSKLLPLAKIVGGGVPQK